MLEGKDAINFFKPMVGGRKIPYKSNGISCPECKNTMVDTEPSVIHLKPPRKRVKCEKCGYKGFREIHEHRR